MSLSRKLLWYVESHLEKELDLAVLAETHGISRFHLTRLFGMSFGQPPMAYIKARRLSEAARKLVSEEVGILDVALGAGYGSHEAFTRAFSEQFGLTPSSVRSSRSLDGLHLTEPLFIMSEPAPEITAPRLVKGEALNLAGLSATYDFNAFGGIPGLWQQFRQFCGHVAAQKGSVTYGVSYNYRPEGLDYMAAMEVGEGDIPAEFTRLKLAPATYAVFEHHGHVSGISATWRAIYDHGLKAANLRPHHVPAFERMDQRFNGLAGSGVIEIWVPVEV